MEESILSNLQIVATIAVSLAFTFSLIHLFVFESVKKSSSMYKKLTTLNSKYLFKNKFPERKDIFEKCSNKRGFDTAIFDDYLEKRIEEEIKFFDKTVSENEEAYQNYRAYVKEYNLLHPEKIETVSRFHLKEWKLWIYNFYERLIFKTYKLKPLRYTKVFVKISYTSPQGKNTYSKSHLYSYDGLKSHYDYIKKLIERKSTRENLIRIERAKVSNSVRISVFKRDHYTCQICGGTKSDGIMLHVDHMIPVSKGGKTEINNLQTLCDRCNSGKSNRDI